MVDKDADRQRRRQRAQAGFTLIELLVVLVILGLLAALAGPRVIGYLGGAKADTAELQVKNFKSALDLYRLDTGVYPTTQQGLNALVRSPGNAAGLEGPLHRQPEPCRSTPGAIPISTRRPASTAPTTSTRWAPTRRRAAPARRPMSRAGAAEPRLHPDRAAGGADDRGAAGGRGAAAGAHAAAARHRPDHPHGGAGDPRPAQHRHAHGDAWPPSPRPRSRRCCRAGPSWPRTGWAQAALMFFPNGTSTGGRVVLAAGDGRRAVERRLADRPGHRDGAAVSRSAARPRRSRLHAARDAGGAGHPGRGHEHGLRASSAVGCAARIATRTGCSWAWSRRTCWRAASSTSTRRAARSAATSAAACAGGSRASPTQVPEDILPGGAAGLDEPLLPPTQDASGERAGPTAGLGTRAADAGEREAFASSDREATDRRRRRRTARIDGRTGPASGRSRKEPLRLRLIRVVVEKGDQRFELSTLAMEAPRERPAPALTAGPASRWSSSWSAWPCWRWWHSPWRRACASSCTAIASTDEPPRGAGGADPGPVGPARRARAGRAADGQGRQSRAGHVLGLADRLRFANVEPPYLAGPPYLAYEYAVTLDARCLPDRPAPRRRSTPTSRTWRWSRTVEPRTILRVTAARCGSPIGAGSGRAMRRPGMRNGRPGPGCPTRSASPRARIPAGPTSWCRCGSPRHGTAAPRRCWRRRGWRRGSRGGDEAIAGMPARASGSGEGDAGSGIGGRRPWRSGGTGRGAGGPGKAGCPGSENDGDRDLLEPGTAAQRPFGDDCRQRADRRRGTAE